MKKIALVYFLLFTMIAHAEVKPTEKISIKIDLICPPSEQLEVFKKSIPDSQIPTVSYEDFEKSITENMTKLIQLIESGKVNNSNWSVKVEPNLPLTE